VSFNFSSITSPTDFLVQFQDDIFNIPIASTASSVDISPQWSQLGLHPTNSTAPTSVTASPSWSDIGLEYQANVDASTQAVQQAFQPSENVLPPASPLLYHDTSPPPAGLLFNSLLIVVCHKLHDLQHESLNLLTDVAAHTSDFDAIVADLPFIEEVENIPPPISAVLPARSPSPEYIVRSPTPPLRYPSPVAAAAVQPPATFDNAYEVDPALFPHLFAAPPCANKAQSHPHQYTVLYEQGRKIWCPQEEFVSQDFLTNIPCASALDNNTPHFVTPFRAKVYHEVQILAQHTLPSVTLCSKVGKHPSSLHFPFGYLESSFIDSLKFLFGQFPPVWLTYFENSWVPLISYDFLDGRLVTIIGYLHFTEEGLFVVNRHTQIEDLIRTNPGLAQFTCTPRTPANPLLYLTPPPVEQPL